MTQDDQAALTIYDRHMAAGTPSMAYSIDHDPRFRRQSDGRNSFSPGKPRLPGSQGPGWGDVITRAWLAPEVWLIQMIVTATR